MLWMSVCVCVYMCMYMCGNITLLIYNERYIEKLINDRSID